jgi:DNA-directed RNA polymerase subunit M/transcription elongation factor TFIIS
MTTFNFFAQDPCSIAIQHNQCPDCNSHLFQRSSKEGIFVHECENCHSSFIESPLGIIRNSIAKHHMEDVVQGF